MRQPGNSWSPVLLPGLALLAGCAAYAALVLASATLPEARALDHITQHLNWHTRPLTTAAWYNTSWAMRSLALALAAGLLGVVTSRAGRVAWHRLWRAVRHTGRSWQQSLTALPPAQRRGAGLALALLTAGRLYFSLSKPLHAEEIASYEFFVSKSWLAVSAYYPIPNNHVLANTLSWGFYQLSPNFWWAMRLPVLLAATAGTVGLFVGTLRWANFRVALLSTGLFASLQLSLYNASAGRGYWLLITLAGLVFFAGLALHRSGGRARVAWAGLLLGGVLGAYTVPTFAYVLASAWGWLGLAWARQRAWAALGQLAAAGLVTALALGLLYTPLLLVSGPAALLGNGFVTARAAGEFWAGLPAYGWFTEGTLAGQRSVGAGLVLAGLGAVAWYWRRTSQHSSPLHRLAGPALWFMLLPYLLLTAQRVFPPERVLLYKAFFFFLLLALVVDAALAQQARPGRWRGLLLAAVGGFVAYQLYHTERLNRRNARPVAAYHAAYAWLARQPPRPLLVPEPLHNLYFRYYAHTEARPWPADPTARPGVRYGYVVAFPARRGAFQPHFSQPPVFRNAEVEVYVP